MWSEGSLSSYRWPGCPPGFKVFWLACTGSRACRSCCLPSSVLCRSGINDLGLMFLMFMKRCSGWPVSLDLLDVPHCSVCITFTVRKCGMLFSSLFHLRFNNSFCSYCHLVAFEWVERQEMFSYLWHAYTDYRELSLVWKAAMWNMLGAGILLTGQSGCSSRGWVMRKWAGLPVLCLGIGADVLKGSSVLRYIICLSVIFLHI